MKDILLYKVMPFVAMVFLSYVTLFTSNVFLILSLIFIIPYFFHRRKLFFTNKYLMLFFVMGLFGSIINLIGTNNGIGGTINFIVSVGIAIFCIENVNFSRFFVLVLGLYTVYFLYSGLFVNNISFYSLYDDIGMSRNYPGFIMCACCCYWGFFKYIKKQEFTVILPILCTVFAFFLDGRSSLGVLFGISLFCLYYTFRKILIVFALCVAIILIYYIDDIINLFLLTNMANNGMETGRYVIWRGYLEHLDLATLILGLNTMDVPEVRAVNGNPHNAFLNFHYRMGLFGLIGLLLIIYRSIKVLVNKERFVMLAFMAFLLFRIFFDACLGSTTDYIIYAIFLYPILYNHKVFRRIRRKLVYNKVLSRHKRTFIRNDKLIKVFQQVEKII